MDTIVQPLKVNAPGSTHTLKLFNGLRGLFCRTSTGLIGRTTQKGRSSTAAARFAPVWAKLIESKHARLKYKSFISKKSDKKASSNRLRRDCPRSTCGLISRFRPFAGDLVPLPALPVIKVSLGAARSLTDGNNNRLFMRRAKGQIDKLATSPLADSGISLESVHRASSTRARRDTHRGGGKKLTGKQLPQHDLIFPGGKNRRQATDRRPSR